MAENGTTLRGIDYKTTFPFVHLFRGFRLAIDPTKIAMAMAAIILLYLGGRVLDAVWPQQHRAVPGELTLFSYEPANFRATRQEMAATRGSQLHQMLVELGHGDWAATRHNVDSALRERRSKAIDAASALPTTVSQPGESSSDEDKTEQNISARDRAIRMAHVDYVRSRSRAQLIAGDGLFQHFLNYEIAQVDNLVIGAIDLQPGTVVLAIKDFFITAPTWAFIVHPVFFTLFFLWLLLIASIFGGGITRVAAVQVARDEKISIRQALRFSSGKVLSFFFAPLIPILIILFLGLLLGAISCLISVPWIGSIWSIVIGAAFFLALLAGLVMMLTAVGLVGGGNLMYPTIAAEGSDSFDAVSRSFSYVYARPWQVIFYSAIALVYGAITFLFVRLSLYVLLQLVHGSIDLFQWGRAADGSPIFDAMWPAPRGFMNLSFATNYAVLNPVQSIGAFCISIWVWLTIALLGAYAISLYFSSSTIIYYLLRKEVDATEMDDVFLEPSDEELSEAPAAEAPETPDAPDAPAVVPPDAPAVVPPGDVAGQPIDLPVPPPQS